MRCASASSRPTSNERCLKQDSEELEEMMGEEGVEELEEVVGEEGMEEETEGGREHGQTVHERVKTSERPQVGIRRKTPHCHECGEEGHKKNSKGCPRRQVLSLKRFLLRPRYRLKNDQT